MASLPIFIIGSGSSSTSTRRNRLLIGDSRATRIEFHRVTKDFLPGAKLSRRERKRVFAHSILWQACIKANSCFVILEEEIYTSLSDEELLRYLTFDNKRSREPGLFFYGKYESECRSHVEEAEIHERKIYKTNSAFGAYAYMITPEAARILLEKVNGFCAQSSYGQGNAVNSASIFCARGASVRSLDDYFHHLCSEGHIQSYCYHPSILKSTSGYTAECMYPIDDLEESETRRAKRPCGKAALWEILWMLLLILLFVIFLLVLYYILRICVTSQNMETIRLEIKNPNLSQKQNHR